MAMVLVTGGAGLVGNELIKQLLANGDTVKAIYHNTPLAQFNNDRLLPVHCDILDVISVEELMEGIEEVYHCAAIVSFDPSKRNQLFKINVEGTANIVNAALSAGIRKMVHVSSVAALGRGAKADMITEQMQWQEKKQNSNYAYSKYLGELEVWRGIGEGLDAVMVNPTIILGAGDWNGGSAQLFKSIYDGFPWYSEGVNGFVDVRDVAAAMIQLMKSDANAERFIINGSNSTYKNVFDLIANAFGKKQPYKKVTPFLAALVWRLEWLKSRITGKSPLVTKETATTAQDTCYYDNSKLKTFLPSFTFHSLADTINDTARALQQKL